jgi:5-methylcytosine-specific restriction protein A
MPPLKPCLDCGKLSAGVRCPPCSSRRGAAQTRAKREVRPYTYAERERRAQVVRAWVQTHGYMCPGYQVPPHPSMDLTADHPHAVAAGGAEDQPLTVLCRSCNSRKVSTGDQGGTPRT